MSATTLGLILFSVSLSALAQFSLKYGMSSAAVQQALSSSAANAVGVVFSSIPVLLGLLLYALGAVTWMLVLANAQVTQAYPFVGIGFIIILVLGHVFLSEPVTLLRVAGVALVLVGIVLISQS